MVDKQASTAADLGAGAEESAVPQDTGIVVAGGPSDSMVDTTDARDVLANTEGGVATSKADAGARGGAPRTAFRRWLLWADRQRRRLRNAWQEGDIAPGRVFGFFAFPAAVVFVVFTVRLMTGEPQVLSPSGQFCFVLVLGATGVYVSLALGAWLRPRTRHAFFFVLGGVASYVVLLAVVGYGPCLQGRVPFFTQIYYAMLLMIGGSPDVLGSEGCVIEPLPVQVAEYTALAVLFAAVIRLIVEVTSPRLAVLTAQHSNRVVLVQGLNADSLPVIRSLTENPDGALIVLVEPDPDHPLLPQAHAMGVQIIEGEISNRQADRVWLRKVITHRKGIALHRAYLLGDNDTLNIADAEIIRQSIASLGSEYRKEHLPPPRIIVRVDRYQQARYYSAEQVKNWGDEDGPRVFISTIGKTQLTAQALVQRVMELRGPGCTVVVGVSDLALAFQQEWKYQQAAARHLAEALGPEAAREYEGNLDELRCLPWGETGVADIPRMFVFQSHKAKMTRPLAWDGLPTAVKLKQFQDTCDEPMVTIVLTDPPETYSLSSLEEIAQQLDPNKTRIFVPRHNVRGIAEYAVLGCLHFYGFSLGGFDREDVRDRTAWGQKPHPFQDQLTESPLLGVPPDSWLRAAKLISDSYGVGRGANTWAQGRRSDRESNFRTLWHTLTMFSRSGYRWVSVEPADYQSLGDGVLVKSDFLQQEHTNWYKFKRHYGWVGASSPAKKEYLENTMCFPWDELRVKDPDGAFQRAKESTLHTLKLNLTALEALGFYAVPNDDLPKV